MKKNLLFIISAVMVGWVFGLFIVRGATKVTICHKEPQKHDVTITVSQNAVEAHIKNHGDTLGACKEGDVPVDVPDEPSPPPTTSTQVETNVEEVKGK